MQYNIYSTIFPAELDKHLNKMANDGWLLRQILVLNENNMIAVMEKEEEKDARSDTKSPAHWSDDD